MYITNLLENTFPKNLGESTEEQLQTIRNYLYQLNEQLRYIFNNLEAENFNETELENMKKEFLAPIETIVKDLEGNLTSIKQGFDKIESTVKDMDGKVSKVTQTVDGWTFTTSDGETYISGNSVRSGKIIGSTLHAETSYNQSSESPDGAVVFWEKDKLGNTTGRGRLLLEIFEDSTTNLGKRIVLEAYKEIGIKIKSQANTSYLSENGSMYLQAPNGQIILSAGNRTRIAAPSGAQYDFREDGIYFGGKKIVSV